MRKLWFVLLGCFFAVCGEARGAGYFRDMYKVSCLPEMGEFRAEMLSLFVDEADINWRYVAGQQGMYEINPTTGLKKPLVREESCVIGETAYKIRFSYVLRDNRYERYKLGMEFFAGEKRIGALFPFGADEDGIYDMVTLRDGKVFAVGCAYEGADRSDCKYVYRELKPMANGGDGFVWTEKEGAVFNAVEFNCFEKLSLGHVRVVPRSENERLSSNFYFVKEEPVFRCGQVEMSFKSRNDVIIRHDGKFFTEFNLGACGKQVLAIHFNPVDFHNVGIRYFDKSDLYRRGKSCWEREACLPCGE